MSEIGNQENLIRQFEARGHVYEGLLKTCDALIRDLLRIGKLRVMAITGRVKEAESLTEKLGRPGKQYESLEDVTDLVGLRIVTFFEDDVDRVAELIAREFELVREHCVDRRAVIEPDRFGYRSLHYVARLPAARRALFENAAFGEQVIEIQIRSILQHAWAEIEHDLGYKGEITIPNEIKRQLSRVAGLLEIADRDFREVRDRSKAYRERVTKELATNQLANISLDAISLREFVSSSPAIGRMRAVLTSELVHGIEGEINVELVLNMLTRVGIKNIAELDDALNKNEKLIVEYERRLFRNDNPTQTLGSNISVFHLAQLLAFQQGGVDGLSNFYSDSGLKGRAHKTSQESAEAASKIMQQATEAAAAPLP